MITNMHFLKALNIMNLPMDANFRFCQHGSYYFDYIADDGEVMLVDKRKVEFVAVLSKLGIF